MNGNEHMSLIQKLTNEELIDKVQGMDNSEYETFVSKIKDISDFNLFDKLIGLQKDVYWKGQDLGRVLLVSKAILAFLDKSPDATPRSKSSILYNMASFTCPWWSDSLDITKEQADQGLQAAKDVLKLRENNNFEPIKQSGAMWILACHYLYTAKDSEKAIEYFTKSESIARSVPEDKLSPLLVGNSLEGIGRTEILVNQNYEKGEQKIHEAMDIYRKNEDEYSEGEAKLFLEGI